MHKNTKHGHTENGKRTPEYQSWKGMKSRCYWKKHFAYKYYGGKGITVCDEWLNSFETFFKDMGGKPSKEYTLDRVDPKQSYSKDNCRWATRAEQSRNQERSIKVKICCQTKTLKEWSRIFSKPYSTLLKYVRAGKDPVELLTTSYYPHRAD